MVMGDLQPRIVLHQTSKRLQQMPMALAGAGEFFTMPVSQHFESHVSIIGAFLQRRIITSHQGELVPASRYLTSVPSGSVSSIPG